MNAQLPIDEKEGNAALVENEGGTPTRFDWSTANDLGLLLRERYRTATALVAARIAIWFLGRSDAELMAWFGLTQPQVNQLRTRLTQRQTAYNTVMGLTGE